MKKPIKIALFSIFAVSVLISYIVINQHLTIHYNCVSRAETIRNSYVGQILEFMKENSLMEEQIRSVEMTSIELEQHAYEVCMEGKPIKTLELNLNKTAVEP